MTANYIGTKFVRAWPERHADGREGYAMIYPDGYRSWSPKDTFESSYRAITAAEKALVNS